MIQGRRPTLNSYSFVARRGGIYIALTDTDRRAPALPETNHVIQRRTMPAIFVVDRALHVLYYRDDAEERRRDCIFDPATDRLPPLVERAVRGLFAEADSEESSQVRSVAPNASIVVRLARLKGGGEPLFAVFVERVKMRASLQAVVERYALSSREREALALVVKGAKNTEIASHLQIAPSTAIFHVKRLMQKTGARNRTELVAKVVG